MLLLSLLLNPILGVLVTFFNKDRGVPSAITKSVALILSILNFFISLFIYILFDHSTNQFQFVQEYKKISNFDLHIGVDGLSIYFSWLTTLIIPISLVSNWKSITKDVESFVFAILLLECLLLAVFLVLDFLLFYIFFESILPPAIWFGKSLPQDPNLLCSAPSSIDVMVLGNMLVTKQINKFSWYTTKHQKPDLELDPYFVTGFVLFFLLLFSSYIVIYEKKV